MDAMQILRFDQARRERWRNDGGWTREIHREGGAEDWRWRISIAEVQADGPFSRFEGVDREIVLVSGNGMHLAFEQATFDLVPESPSLRFAGEAAVDCRLIDGPTTDFNLMWSREQIEAELWRRPLVGGSLLPVAAGETWVVHLLTGQLAFVDVAEATLAPGDTAILRGGRSQRIEAAGSAVFIRLRDRTQGG